MPLQLFPQFFPSLYFSSLLKSLVCFSNRFIQIWACLTFVYPGSVYTLSFQLTNSMPMVCVFLQAGTHGLTTGGTCIPCHCNSYGSKSFDCDENGQCRCQPGVTGPKCDRCSQGYFNFQEGGCTRKHRIFLSTFHRGLFLISVNKCKFGICSKRNVSNPPPQKILFKLPFCSSFLFNLNFEQTKIKKSHFYPFSALKYCFCCAQEEAELKQPEKICKS